MYNTVSFVIVGILVGEFLLERWLDKLNTSWRNKPVPKELEGIYDKEKYEKQQAYARENASFDLLSSSVSIIITISFIAVGGFAWLNQLLADKINAPIWIGILFFLIIFLASDILSMPFTWYQTFHIESKYGFNKSTPRLFLVDKLKSYLLSFLIGGLLYIVIFKLYQFTQEMFWIYTLIVMIAFMVFMTMFYSNLIVPLFNKQKPLADGALKTALKTMPERLDLNWQIFLKLMV